MLNNPDQGVTLKRSTTHPEKVKEHIINIKKDPLSKGITRKAVEQIARNYTAFDLREWRNSERVGKEIKNSTELRKLNTKLEKLAMTDSLTKLPNRRFLLSQLKQEYASAVRNKHKLTIMLIDLDHFKKINDTHSHKIGDEYLKIVATAMRRVFRTSDVIARYGGEEFCAVLPETDDGEIVKKIVQRLQQTYTEYQKYNKSLKKNKVTTLNTMSIGVTTLGEKGFLKAGKKSDYMELFNQADLALYAAKKRGRNQMVKFDSPEYKKYLEQIKQRKKKKQKKKK